MFYPLDILKLNTKTKTKNQNFLSKKMFSCPSNQKCIKKSSNFHLHQQKRFGFKFLVSVYSTDKALLFVKEGR